MKTSDLNFDGFLINSILDFFFRLIFANFILQYCKTHIIKIVNLFSIHMFVKLNVIAIELLTLNIKRYFN